MSDKCFVDTNVLVYAHDSSAGWKRDTAHALMAQLWGSGSGVLSTQVLQELCVALRRKAALPLSADDTRKVVETFLSWEIVVNTPVSVFRALYLESRYQISFWDALILQAAEGSGATILYSEDLASGQKYGSVRVVNPFAISAR
jgi:predicted nucleic acid-binding protein